MNKTDLFKYITENNPGFKESINFNKIYTLGGIHGLTSYICKKPNQKWHSRFFRKFSENDFITYPARTFEETIKCETMNMNLFYPIHHTNLYGLDDNKMFLWISRTTTQKTTSYSEKVYIATTIFGSALDSVTNWNNQTNKTVTCNFLDETKIYYIPDEFYLLEQGTISRPIDKGIIIGNNGGFTYDYYGTHEYYNNNMTIREAMGNNNFYNLEVLHIITKYNNEYIYSNLTINQNTKKAKNYALNIRLGNKPYYYMWWDLIINEFNNKTYNLKIETINNYEEIKNIVINNLDILDKINF